jgi:hypothetical protein
VAHLERQVHDLSGSVVPGLTAAGADQGCRAAMYSAYSAVLRHRLAFVSLDEDERQLRRLLEAQPRDGVRARYWLPERSRPRWLGPFGVTEQARLPVHALVSPRGELACVVTGAVEESDYARLAQLLRSPGR